MNVDLVNGSTARWWVVVVLSVALFVLVIATWGLMKSPVVSTPSCIRYMPECATNKQGMQFKEWSDNYGGASRLTALPRRGWKRMSMRKPVGDVEAGIAMIAGIQGGKWVKSKHH